MSASQSGTSPKPNENLGTMSSRRKAPLMTGAGIAVVIVVAIIAVVAGWLVGYYVTPNKGSSTSYGTTVTELGSSLLAPAVIDQWGPNFTAQNPGILVSGAAGGSGMGQVYAQKGLVDIGGSDAYISNASATNLINFPMAISSQLIYYNLPGVSAHLNMNATFLADVYLGTITNWNNSLLQAANPGVSLPSHAIIPVARSDSSGDTFLFTSYLYMGDAAWNTSGHGYSTGKLSGHLASNIVYASGNGGMVTALTGTAGQYAIAYIGVSYQAQAAAAGLVYANLGDNLANSASGGTVASNYIAWSAQNVAYDANLALTKLQFSTYGLALSMIMGGPAGGAIDLVAGAGGTSPTTANPTPYPDVNLEYGLVKTTGAPGGPTQSWYVVQFLQWVITIGNLPQYLNPVHFLPLTTAVVADCYTELLTIQTSQP